MRHGEVLFLLLLSRALFTWTAAYRNSWISLAYQFTERYQESGQTFCITSSSLRKTNMQSNKPKPNSYRQIPDSYLLTITTTTTTSASTSPATSGTSSAMVTTVPATSAPALATAWAVVVACVLRLCFFYEIDYLVGDSEVFNLGYVRERM